MEKPIATNDCLKLFNLQPPFSTDQITRAYRALMKENHPDLHDGDSVYTKKAARINECADLLRRAVSDPTVLKQSTESEPVEAYDTWEEFTLDLYINYLRNEPKFDVYLDHVFSQQPPRYREAHRSFHPDIVKYLNQQGWLPLYTHQAEAINHIRHGDNVILVTPTASGKSLSYLLPFVDAVQANSEATGLFLFPLRALANDQMQKLADFDIASVAKYDGTTSTQEKKQIRKNPPNALFTNPDELHQSILRTHTEWQSFLKNLQFIVVDDVHLYRGYFGTNVANIMYRLKHAVEQAGGKYQVVVTSATLENAKAFAEQLTGTTDFHVIDSSGAGAGKKTLLMVESLQIQTQPLYDPDSYWNAFDRAMEFVALQTLILAGNGIQSLVFAHSRTHAEILTTFTRLKAQKIFGKHSENKNLQNEPGIAEMPPSVVPEDIIAYHAGYNDGERRERETKIQSGEAKIIFSTSALESGIDIGQLQVCFLFGIPSESHQIWQRIGRVGRNPNKDSLVVVVNTGSTVDRYYAVNPEEFLATKDSTLAPVIYPMNPTVRGYHHQAGHFEGIQATDVDDPDVYKETVDPAYDKSGAYIRIPLRNPSTIYKLQDENGQNIDQVEYDRIFRDLYPKGIYRRGQQVYRVDNIDWGEKTIRLEQSNDRDFFTLPATHVDVQMKKDSGKYIEMKTPVAPLTVGYGECKVTEYVEGFVTKYINHDYSYIYNYEKEIRKSFRTTAAYLSISKEHLKAWNKHIPGFWNREAGRILHGVEHLLRHCIVAKGYCENNDIHGYAAHNSEQFGGPACFLYDKTPRGIGIAEQIYTHIDELLALAMHRIKHCPCESGCLHCILTDGWCDKRNKSLDKELTQDFLSQVTGITEFLPAPAPTPGLPPHVVTGSDRPGYQQDRTVERGRYKVGDRFAEAGTVISVDADEITVLFDNGDIEIIPYHDTEY